MGGLVRGQATKTGLQALLGERFLQKSERLYGRRPSACLRIGVGSDEDAADAKSGKNFFGSFYAVASANETDVHQHHIGALTLSKSDRLIRRYRGADDSMAEGLKQRLRMQRDEKLVLNDQDAEGSTLELGTIALIAWLIAVMGRHRGQPELHGRGIHFCENHEAAFSCRLAH